MMKKNLNLCGKTLVGRPNGRFKGAREPRRGPLWLWHFACQREISKRGMGGRSCVYDWVRSLISCEVQ